MASEEKQRTLLALAPLFLHPLPIIQTPQLLYSTTGTTDAGSVSVEFASATALTTAGMLPREQPPHPQQGGHRITIQYLRELPDAEARWAFRYVS